MPISEKQIDFINNSNHSFNIAIGSIRSGKTFAQILRWYKYVYDSPNNCLLLMSGKTSESLHDNVIKDFAALNPSDIIVTQNPLRVKIKSKKIEIACADANNESSWGRIQGKTVYGWLADEITRHPESFVLMAQGRCSGGGKVQPKFWTCNPDSPHHFIKTRYVDNPNIDCRTWNFSFKDNPILSDAYKKEIEQSYTGVYYDRLVSGLWALAEGTIYDEFIPELHIQERECLDAYRYIQAIDYGYNNPFVCLFAFIDEDNRVHIYDEIYKTKTLLKDLAQEIKDKTKFNIEYRVADHDAQDNAEMREYGIQTRNAKKEVLPGIAKVKLRFKQSENNRNNLTISKKCVNLIRELSLYRWAQKSGSEIDAPLKQDDHAMDALRYLIFSVDGASVPKVRTI